MIPARAIANAEKTAWLPILTDMAALPVEVGLAPDEEALPVALAATVVLTVVKAMLEVLAVVLGAAAGMVMMMMGGKPANGGDTPRGPGGAPGMGVPTDEPQRTDRALWAMMASDGWQFCWTQGAAAEVNWGLNERTITPCQIRNRSEAFGLQLTCKHRPCRSSCHTRSELRSPWHIGGRGEREVGVGAGVRRGLRDQREGRLVHRGHRGQDHRDRCRWEALKLTSI